MKMPTRQRSTPALPGVVGPVRGDRRTARLLPRLRPGDVAIVDHHDLDRATAQALVDAGVTAVLDAAPVLSGRYPALGPDVLVDAGVLVIDGLGSDVLGRLKDGTPVRLHEGGVHLLGDDAVEVGRGRVVDRAVLDHELDRARVGLGTQLESFTHNSTEFLRREQDLLLHGQGVPRLRTRLEGRPVVVVVAGRDHDSELAGIRRFLQEQDPVLIGVEGGADVLRRAGLRPDVVVVDADADDGDLPVARTVREARDLVVVVDRGSSRAAAGPWERMGVRPARFESGATPEDAALVLADTWGASLIVGVGMHATLDEFLDRQRAGLASTYLTRLKVGERLVDAAAVPALYAGRVRPRHLLGVAVAGLMAVLAAVATTPVGHEWTGDLVGWLDALGAEVSARIEGAPVEGTPMEGPQ